MKINQKLTLGFLSVALLVGLVGYISVAASQKTLQKSIGENSVLLATEILDKIDRNLYDKIERFQGFADPSLQEIIIKSNQEFEELDNVQNYINEKDREWTSVSKEEITPFMKDLINNKLSKALRKRAKFYESKYGFRIFSEVFVTNKYGANAAQTGKTTDYRQDDEQWWQRAKEDNLYVSDVEYDKSADVYSTAIGIRIDDKERDFLGVMKVVLNIEEVVSVVKEAKAAAKYETTELILITTEGKIIYSTKEFQPFDEIPDELSPFFKHPKEIVGTEKHLGYFVGEAVKTERGDKLFAHAHSGGCRDFEGLGWVLVIEYETEEIFAPVAKLRNLLLIISSTITALAIVLGLFISKSISNPLSKLTAASAKLGKGDLDAKIEVVSKGEIGELAQSFNEMAGKLKESYAGLEEKVRQRTAELTSANENLEAEIEQRIKVEQTLRESRKELNKQNKFLNNVLESLTYPFYVINANDYTVLMANPAAYPEKLPEKATCYTLLYDQDKPCDECLLEKIKKTGEPVTVEHVHYDEDGKPKYVEVHGYPVFNSEGNLSQIIEYSFDITERKKAEQRQAELIKEVEIANQELKDFAYVVSHDLKAPLRGVSTLTEWLSTDYRDKFDEEGKQDLDLILGRVERMQNLIDGILEYSRVGRMEEEKVQINLNELVSDVIDMVAPTDNIKITLENELPVVRCEQTRITQVFENLLSNAIKYMDKSQGQIKISCVEENSFWKFGVADNGLGIEEKYFERIFRIFQTLEPQDKSGRTGIGLTVIKKIVELYGGRIWLESKLGQGSTFYFTLPKQESPFCEVLQNGSEEMGVKDEKLKANIVS